MKIYNKKGFMSGIFGVILGSAALISGIVRGIRIKSLILGFLVLTFGIDAMARSLSKNATTKDKIADEDKRNQFIRYRSQAKALTLIRIIAFLLTVILLLVGTHWQIPLFLGMGISAGVLLNLSLLIEIGASIYYEKNS